ncbi:MAG: pyruvate, water dikinase regulatory protein [Coriobacteriales bacterium]|jgi:regulator of PEP synthase PpsR (kinase-PPPase family)
MENYDFDEDETSKNSNELSIYIISDSLGDTASALVSAAMSQFTGEKTKIERLSKISSVDQTVDFLESRLNESENEVVFFTIADPDIARSVSAYVESRGVSEVDLLGPAVSAIARATGKSPNLRAGINHRLDEAYFKRIEAMDYAVDHDDGRLPEEYKDADIVLIGVSRTSKTPLSMYLASRGYKVANLPLAPGVDPPKQIYDVDVWRIFGLMSSPEVLYDIRQKRLGPAAARIAKNYADEDYIIRDLQEARAFMRKLGCIVVHTDNRAIEETAQEIIRYYENALAAGLDKK